MDAGPCMSFQRLPWLDDASSSPLNYERFTPDWRRLLGWRDVSDESAVLRTLAEFDEIGRNEFLDRHEFGKAKGTGSLWLNIGLQYIHG